LSIAEAEVRAMSRDEPEKVVGWPDGKSATVEEPWAWFNYMKLRETLELIVSGMEATTAQTEDSEPQPRWQSLE
jgi:hypothetical protein